MDLGANYPSDIQNRITLVDFLVDTVVRSGVQGSLACSKTFIFGENSTGYSNTFYAKAFMFCKKHNFPYNI
jgi:hypothetical protein